MDLRKYLPVGADIETIPSQDTEIIEALKVSSVYKATCPDWTKDKFIEALKGQPYPTTGLKVDDLKKLYMEAFGGDLAAEAFEKEYRKLSFSALDGGEVISASAYPFGSDSEPVNKFRWLELGTPETNMLPQPGGPSEGDIIDAYFRWFDKVNEFAKGQNKQLLIVGANIKNFDFKFLARRALHLGVDLPTFSLADTGYISRRYFDVIEVFGFYDRQDKVRLDKICKFLNIETPKADEYGEIDGSMVWDIWANNGKEGAERIANYNKRDSKVLEPIFNKLHWLVD